MYCAVFLYSGNIFYASILQYAIGSQIDANNRTIRVLMYPMYSGHFDVQKSPIYEITYALQCFCTVMMNVVICGCCGLAALFATHACGQIDIIMSQLDDLIDGKFSEKNYNSYTRLMEIVQRHTKVLKYKHEGKVNRCLSLLKNMSRAIADFLRRLKRYCRKCAFSNSLVPRL